MCSIEGCSGAFYAKGWCVKHYSRMRAHGDPHVNLNLKTFVPNPDLWVRNGMRAADLPVRPGFERIASIILARSEAADEGCWMWTGCLDPAGYGRVSTFSAPEGTSALAHRALYAALVDDPTPGMHLDHLRRRRACVNPGHLDLVEPKVNLTRGLGPIAERARAKFCIRGHRFDEANTYYTKTGARMCRKCNAIRQRATKERRLARLSGSASSIAEPSQATD